MKRAAVLSLAAALCTLALHAQQRIYWGDEVPKGWAGAWPAELQTVAERSNYTRTMSSLQNIEFITALRGKSEQMHVVNMFTSPQRKVAPAIVIANPRVTSAQEARASGKPVRVPVREHPSAGVRGGRGAAHDRARPDGRQAQGPAAEPDRHHPPVFNVDGTDTFQPQDGSLGSETPHILGVRANSQGLDLNRDAVKLETVEANGLYRMLNEWDPVLLLDGHLMSRVNHGYANTYGTTTVPAAAPGPRDYMHDTLFPGGSRAGPARTSVSRCSRTRSSRPTRGRRTRGATTARPGRWKQSSSSTTTACAIAWRSSRRRPASRHSSGASTRSTRYIMSLLEYTNAHAKEMQAVVKEADDETVADVQAKAAAGELRNWLDGEYQSRGKIDVLGVSHERGRVPAGNQFPSTKPGTAIGPARSRARAWMT